MSHKGLTRMTKVEVVIESGEEAHVRELFTAAGVTGYTAVTGVSGLGHGGYHEGALLFNERSALSMLITVAPDEKAGALVSGLRTLLEQRSGVMFVSDVYVSRPEYFAA